MEIAWQTDDLLMRVFDGQSWVRTSFEQKLCLYDAEELIAGESRARFRASIPLFCESCPHRSGCLGGCR